MQKDILLESECHILSAKLPQWIQDKLKGMEKEIRTTIKCIKKNETTNLHVGSFLAAFSAAASLTPKRLLGFPHAVLRSLYQGYASVCFFSASFFID
jgi:hypothetical protein